MERCLKCKRESEYKLVDKWYCGRCFSELVEQKIKQNLRKYDIKKDSKLSISDKASEYIIKKVINLPVKIVSDEKNADYLILPWTLDDENEEFMKKILENKKINTKEDKKKIKLFYPVSKQDLTTYFKIKNIDFRPDKTEINDFLDRMEAKYPETKRALLNSEEKLKKMIR